METSFSADRAVLSSADVFHKYFHINLISLIKGHTEGTDCGFLFKKFEDTKNKRHHS